MDDFQLKLAIMGHLKGVPFEAIDIPPNILHKMKDSPSAYRYYMDQLDEFVRGYQKYHQPGVVEMSFSISEDGQCCITADPVYLDPFYEDEGSGEAERLKKHALAFIPEQLGMESYGGTDLNLLAYFAGANFLERERISYFNAVE